MFLADKLVDIAINDGMGMSPDAVTRRKSIEGRHRRFKTCLWVEYIYN